ncbi:MAG TPA: sugar phosphate isomerase/epimerase family protein [Chitinophagaceae bacterium]|jgi:sugar phosphate isomerase/epimerase|nr:sugar phosphate isomerase/epimerase family protein [Chitinophagaceae bacterium]
MNNHLHRRKFLSSIIGIPAMASAGIVLNTQSASAKKFSETVTGLKTSLNAYSFNAPLSNGSMTISDLLDFCATSGFEGVDITAYYFKGYPQVPSDEYLFQIKRKAFSLGIEISGTGVRNDFTLADNIKHQQEVVLVKNWIEVAAKIGAPVIRIFAGNQKNENFTKEQVTEWMLKDIQTCVEYGKQHGVIIGIQNHNDFIQTADQVNKIIEAINSEWLGLILDTGSYRVHDPYQEIVLSVKHAVNWQIKEKIFINGEEKEVDLDKLMGIIKSSGYKGYLPIETLGEGDPKSKVPAFLAKVQKAML